MQKGMLGKGPRKDLASQSPGPLNSYFLSEMLLSFNKPVLILPVTNSFLVQVLALESKNLENADPIARQMESTRDQNPWVWKAWRQAGMRVSNWRLP